MTIGSVLLFARGRVISAAGGPAAPRRGPSTGCSWSGTDSLRCRSTRAGNASSVGRTRGSRRNRGKRRSLLPKAPGRGPRWRLPRHGWPRYASTSWHPLSGSVWLPEAIEGLAARVREQVAGRLTCPPRPRRGGSPGARATLPTSWTRDPDSAAVEIERRILTKQQAAHYIGRSDNEHVEARQREDVSQLAAPPANRQWNEGEVCAVARQVRDRQCHAVATLQADGRTRTELLLRRHAARLMLRSRTSA
jgi:hypothetical protein